MNGDEYPERRIRTQWVMRSAVKGKHLGASWGSALCGPLISMVTWDEKQRELELWRAVW